MNLFTLQDFFLGIVYLGIIYAVAYGLKSQQQKKGWIVNILLVA